MRKLTELEKAKIQAVWRKYHCALLDLIKNPRSSGMATLDAYEQAQEEYREGLVSVIGNATDISTTDEELEELFDEAMRGGALQ